MPTPAEGFDPGQQFLEGERLDEVVVRPGCQPEYLVIEPILTVSMSTAASTLFARILLSTVNPSISGSIQSSTITS